MKKVNQDELLEYMTDCIKQLVELGLKRELSPRENNRILFFCSQLYGNPYLQSINDSIQLLINKNLEYLRKNPEEYLYSLPIGMFDSMGQYAFSINTLEKKNGELKKLSYSLSQLLGESLWNVIPFLKNSPVSFRSYDVILGPSGIASHLIRNNNNVISTDLYKEFLNYLVWITEDYQYQQWMLPRFHIHREEQFLEYERNSMKNGQVNFGMAHGMLGILETLTIAMENHIEVEGQKKAIDKLFAIYDRFEIYENGILKFPRRLAAEDYFSGKISDISVNSGWCYGNSGMVRGLMISAKRMGYVERYQHYHKELLKILNQTLEEYNLKTPIVCHGYASVLAIQLASYRETKNSKFLTTFHRNFDTLALKFIDTSLSELNFESSIDFLEGTAGVILTLLDGLNHERKYLNYGEILLIE